MLYDEKKNELDRLTSIGLETYGPETPRELLTAKMIAPQAWSDNAQAHIDYCHKQYLLQSSTHQGAIFLSRRRLAVIHAKQLLKNLDRQAAGKKDLKPLSAMSLSNKLQDDLFKRYTKGKIRQHPSDKGANAVFFLKCSDGIPEPKANLDDDGAVVLTWQEEQRKVVIEADTYGRTTITIGDQKSQQIEFKEWDNKADRLLVSATNWVYFGGACPDEINAHL